MNPKSRLRRISIACLLILPGVLFLVACGGEDQTFMPKPVGYYRITMPEKEYQVFDTIFPYSFEYPRYSHIEPDMNPGAEKYWINITFPQFRGKIYLSYLEVKNNLNLYLEDTRTFTNKHIPFATAISERVIVNDTNRVYGILYKIEGSQTASSLQFFLTDSTTHFLRGALYFDAIPNNDSLAPVIDFIGQDIDHLIETLKWKGKEASTS
ncbi:MAG: gliding motility lipoprotein GldD [Bacteroidetes bacterium]|nr:gliding motility lipoprotein GldD [Bacteroidota bacterium]MBU1719853.1 gliding motility lipoprotein GldD [Bacteroidota bacterium]